MPCMGPDLDDARERSIDAAEKVWQFLRQEYHIFPPSERDFVKKPELIDKMKTLMEEIFVNDAINSF